MKKIVALILFLLVGFSSAAWAERLAVAVPEANIRSGPGTKYNINWKVGMYHPLKIIKKKGVWYKFRDFENDEGWIHKKLLKKMATVITIKGICNVRTGPSKKKDIAFTVEKGVPFKVLERRGQWIHILHADGDKGWIYASLVW